MQNKSNFVLEFYQLFDFLTLGLAFLLAYYTKIALVPDIVRGLDSGHNYLLVFLLTSIPCQFSLRFTETYPPFKHKHFQKIIAQVIKAVFAGIIFSLILLYLIHIGDISRLLMGLYTIFSIILLSSVKGIMFFILNKKLTATYKIQNVLIVGSRDRSLDVIKTIINTPTSAYHIIGCLETFENKARIGKEIYKSVKIIGTLEIFNSILLEKSVDEIIFALPLKDVKNIHNYIYFAERMGINIRIMPDFQIHKIKFYPKHGTVQIDHFLGLPTLVVSSTSPNELGLYLKSIFDYASAAVALVILTPLFLVIAAFIKLTSPGPIFFYQMRYGLNGRQFYMRKFRTMSENAEEERKALEKDNEMDGPVFKITNDPRITKVGRFLRKSSFDELPQLINVLHGEMSLVGPRPLEDIDEYQLWQRRRLSMKPGITCIWQVSGRNEVSFEQWMKMDLEYIDNWSLLLDFKLLFLTIKEVFRGGGK
jgi:exopolysaccharide biosynthesis polyprenyl glycosylphosphotransferase